MIRRTNCALCKENLEFFHIIKDFPVYMGIRDKDEIQLYENMEFSSCSNCGCVQLSNLIDPKVLYKKPHNPAIGKTWELHNQELSNYIVFNNPKNAIDIGGANMKIANAVCENSSIISYTVCDLSAGLYDGKTNSKIKIIKDYVENVKTDKKYDVAILSHTLEHFYNPVDILLKIKNMLTDDGAIIISVPNIEQQLKDGFLNALNFEHTYYISHAYMNLMSKIAGLEIVDIHEFSRHNCFYKLKKINEPKELVYDKLIAKNVYETFVKNLVEDVININSQIKGKKVYCFGGHIFTQMLIAYGLNVENLLGVLDNDKNKIGKFLYGSNLMIYNPSCIKQEKAPIVIVRTAQYKDEIIESIKIHNENVSII